jgi:hypothetical protein
MHFDIMPDGIAAPLSFIIEPDPRILLIIGHLGGVGTALALVAPRG